MRSISIYEWIWKQFLDLKFSFFQPAKRSLENVLDYSSNIQAWRV